MDAVFFESATAFRKWLDENYDKASAILVGFYKKDSGKLNMTYQEALDQALCYGWIDGVRKSIDDISYTIRFTPRKPRSIWSNVNIKRVSELIESGLMQPAGLTAFEARTEERSGVYSAEQGDIAFTPEQEQQFKANSKAWEFFQSQPPSYCKPAVWWVISAKKEETKVKRMAELIDYSEKGERVPPLRPRTRA
jgi:uncharacterized protein YdeI (YjbR/CyaY-like superfamily)